MEQQHIKLYDYLTTRLNNGDILESELIQWYNSIKSRIELLKNF
jgi:hypothetical protein